MKRETVAGDRRRRTLTLSRAGRKAVESADALLRERFGSLLAGLPGREADALSRALPHVEAALSGSPPPRRPPPPRPPHPPGRHDPVLDNEARARRARERSG